MEGISLKATAHVTLTKLDEHGNVIGTEKHEVNLTGKEASALWHSLQKD